MFFCHVCDCMWFYHFTTSVFKVSTNVWCNSMYTYVKISCMLSHFLTTVKISTEMSHIGVSFREHVPCQDSVNITWKLSVEVTIPFLADHSLNSRSHNWISSISCRTRFSASFKVVVNSIIFSVLSKPHLYWKNSEWMSTGTNYLRKC